MTEPCKLIRTGVLASLREEAHPDVFTVLPTSGGKSLLFLLDGLMGCDLTLVVSPLISLTLSQLITLNRCNR